jgi:hypothetical protein
MFFRLTAIEDHPCCKMQEVVESFFLNSVQNGRYSLNLFPLWVRPTLGGGTCTLSDKFSRVHNLLHGDGMDEAQRQGIYDQVRLTNHIKDLCDGSIPVPTNVVDWDSELGMAISELMFALYDSLDLAVFRRNGQAGQPTKEFYREFIKKNKHVCPFCGLAKFKNRKGARREDFDHYLYKAEYRLAAANMANLVPTCGVCNQDYKKTKDILADGAAFYPYGSIPTVKLAVDCTNYPAVDDFADTGTWSVSLELLTPDPAVAPKMHAWDRVYSIKQRLANEIAENGEDWMKEAADDVTHPLDGEGFRGLITSAKARAERRSQRRMEPAQIVRAAFYDFILNRANTVFVESFRRLLNASLT